MVFMVMLMYTIVSCIAKQCFQMCSDCIEILPPRDTIWRRLVVCWGSGFWMSTSPVALVKRRHTALPVRREVLERITAQRLDRKLLLRASISAVKLRQDERMPQAISCLAHVDWKLYNI